MLDIPMAKMYSTAVSNLCYFFHTGWGAPPTSCDVTGLLQSKTSSPPVFPLTSLHIPYP